MDCKGNSLKKLEEAGKKMMMNKMTNDNIVEEALTQLNMKCRSVTYKKKFDLLCNNREWNSI